MESEPGAPFRPRSARLVAAAALPEVEYYFHLLVLIHLIDTECYNEVSFYQATILAPAVWKLSFNKVATRQLHFRDLATTGYGIGYTETWFFFFNNIYE